jgi:hypothetical protein
LDLPDPLCITAEGFGEGCFQLGSIQQHHLAAGGDLDSFSSNMFSNLGAMSAAAQQLYSGTKGEAYFTFEQRARAAAQQVRLADLRKGRDTKSWGRNADDTVKH